MKIYRSKIGWMILLPIIILIGGTAVLLAIKNIWLGAFLAILSLLLVWYLFLFITYTITGETLKIKHSFLFSQSIHIPDIKKIRETRNPLAAPASSLDRLEIIYKRGSILVSPKLKAEFISHLLSINPTIEVTMKNNAMVNLSH